MTRFHIVGGKNHGKTRLTVDLVQEFTGRGLRVGTIKHTHHWHELDTPGKDSHQHRLAGAAVVGIVSPAICAIYSPTPTLDAGASIDPYERIWPMFDACDLVIVEGDSQAVAPKVEVWRACRGTSPLCQRDAGILAVVTDDTIHVRVPVLPRSDVPALASWVVGQAWFPAQK
jgi:molybdopterin-guanine dinucleotide biosynthesis protein MobB